jgi:hypothetical protein
MLRSTHEKYMELILAQGVTKETANFNKKPENYLLSH